MKARAAKKKQFKLGPHSPARLAGSSSFFAGMDTSAGPRPRAKTLTRIIQELGRPFFFLYVFLRNHHVAS